MQTSTSLVSIIIPTYNRAGIIGETLESIRAQTNAHWECILVDDGSTDHTLDILHAYAAKDHRFKIHQRPSHLKKGPNSCRNYGFEKSRGDIINWFDSDDLYQPNALAEVITQWQEGVDAVVVKVERFNSETGKTVDYNTIQSKTLIEDYLTGKVTFYVCGPFWKRTFLEKQEALFDAHIRNLDDWDFNLRMLYQKPQIVYLEQALIRYRKFHWSLSKALVHHNHEEIRSAFYAREKHVALLKSNKSKALKPFNTYIIKQYKMHLKALLYANNSFSKTILKRLIIKQLSLFKIVDAVKTFAIGGFYLLLKKGNFLLKKL